jgi:hypothetical protein
MLATVDNPSQLVFDATSGSAQFFRQSQEAAQDIGHLRIAAINDNGKQSNQSLGDSYSFN